MLVHLSIKSKGIIVSFLGKNCNTPCALSAMTTWFVDVCTYVFVVLIGREWLSACMLYKNVENYSNKNLKLENYNAHLFHSSLYCRPISKYKTKQQAK